MSKVYQKMENRGNGFTLEMEKTNQKYFGCEIKKICVALPVDLLDRQLFRSNIYGSVTLTSFLSAPNDCKSQWRKSVNL